MVRERDALQWESWNKDLIIFQLRIGALQQEAQRIGQLRNALETQMRTRAKASSEAKYDPQTRQFVEPPTGVRSVGR